MSEKETDNSIVPAVRVFEARMEMRWVAQGSQRYIETRTFITGLEEPSIKLYGPITLEMARQYVADYEAMRAMAV